MGNKVSSAISKVGGLAKTAINYAAPALSRIGKQHFTGPALAKNSGKLFNMISHIGGLPKGLRSSAKFLANQLNPSGQGYHNNSSFSDHYADEIKAVKNVAQTGIKTAGSMARDVARNVLGSANSTIGKAVDRGITKATDFGSDLINRNGKRSNPSMSGLTMQSDKLPFLRN